ncbi:MAG: ShlB/FhaC/HecB family hemolysin secretion/activation protein [Verrucomicrobiales bacterium]|nr:ShlB/FhaC/HecB family hemolysin secretion/activation protein [Verrucomicrobiales bacterium]
MWQLNLSAQQLQPDPGQRLLEQEQRRQAEERLMRQQPAADREMVERQRPSEVTDEEKNAPGFFVKRIILKDNTLLEQKVLRKFLSPYENKKINRYQIDRVINDLTNAYIDAGFVTTRVYIPAQNIAETQTLELVAVEGKIETLTVNDDRWPRRLGGLMAFPTGSGEILQLRDLEQGLDQMNRVPSANAKMQLHPGEKQGETKVLIKNEPKGEYRFYAGYDNLGQSSTGRNRVKLSGEVDNVLNLNDTWSAYYQGARDSNAVAVTASVPYEWWTLTQSFTYSDYLIGLEPGMEIFGDTYSFATSLEQLVYRDARQKTTVFGSLEVKNSGRILNDVILAPQPLTVLRLGARHTYRADRGFYAADFTISQGAPIFGAHDNESGLQWDSPHAVFTKLEASVSAYQGLTGWLSLRSSLRGQYAVQGLYGSEQMFLGDFNTVRGYINSNAVGDDGFYTRNELCVNIPPLTKIDWLDWFLTKVQPYTFLDGGYAIAKTQSSGVTLVGAGIGGRFIWDRFTAEILFGAPLTHSVWLPHDEPVTYFTMTLKAW